MSRVVSTLRRSYTSVVAGAATTLGIGQMLFLKATYASPPDAFGPREGVESPAAAAAAAAAANAAAAAATTTTSTAAAASTTPGAEDLATLSAVDAAPASPSTPISPAVASAAGVFVASSSAAAVTTNPGGMGADSVLAPRQLQPSLTAAAAAVLRVPRPRILVIGDSLVSGVGGNASWTDGPKDGPPLPKQVARFLSQRWNADVQWNAMSLTGGDVRMLRRKILPMLKRERDRAKEDPASHTPLTAVVLVTGVNDWKRMSPRRTATRFRKDLADFIISIRAEVGEDCHVFLPAIPGVHHAPRFHDPLRYFLIFINDYWDSQKLALARAMKNVHFVGNPPEADWTNRPAQFFCTQDRLHPSELGYQRWGERIAAQIAVAVDRGRATLNSYRNISPSQVIGEANPTDGVATVAATVATKVVNHSSISSTSLV